MCVCTRMSVFVGVTILGGIVQMAQCDSLSDCGEECEIQLLASHSGSDLLCL